MSKLIAVFIVIYTGFNEIDAPAVWIKKEGTLNSICFHIFKCHSDVM